MSDQQKVKELLRGLDPARNLRAPAVDPRRLMRDAPAERPRRRPRLGLVVAAGLAGLVAAGAAVVVTHQPRPPQVGAQVRTEPSGPGGYDFWPVVRPMAFERPQPPAAPKAAAFDGQHGKYTHIGIVSWNASFDDEPGGDTQVVMPQTKDIWFDRTGAGRMVTHQLPPVFLNEASRRYYEKKGLPRPTGTPAPTVNDLGPDMVGSSRPLPGVEQIFEHGNEQAFRTISDINSIHLVPLDYRTRLLQRLTRTEGVEWVGRTVDRAGRTGIAARITGETTQVLVFDPVTGALLAWDEIDRQNVVQGSMLFVKTEVVDRMP